MFCHNLPRHLRSLHNRVSQMASHMSKDAQNQSVGVTLAGLTKSNVFTSKLPPDPAFETPESSHNAPRETLGPRLVKGAMYTFVRPENADRPELLGVSPKALEDIGLRPGEEETQDFQALVAGNKIFWSEQDGGIYPWAQCYGGEWPSIMNYKRFKDILTRKRLAIVSSELPLSSFSVWLVNTDIVVPGQGSLEMG
jgi:hypothetical protein